MGSCTANFSRVMIEKEGCTCLDIERLFTSEIEIATRIEDIDFAVIISERFKFIIVTI